MKQLYTQRTPDTNRLIIQEQISLRDKHCFATGGPARFFVTPHNILAFQEALTFADQQQLPIFVLGTGANILISDNGFDGLVIQPKLDYITNHHTTVTAGAGVTISDLINFCLNHNLIGLEEFSGIPGTVGGSIYINLHYFNFLLEQFLVKAQVIHKQTGALTNVERDWFNFSYNYSRLHTEPYILLEATFNLKRATDLEVAYARGRQTEIIRHRTARYPTHRTCGSFFRNFFEHEVTLEQAGQKIIYVAYYLDKLGIKGNLQYGGAQVSHKHANMIINLGNATSSDIIALARTMQHMMQENYQLTPQPECQLIGFNEYPLFAVAENYGGLTRR